MKFSDVFPVFDATDNYVEIQMDEEVARSLTPAQAVKFSRMKFEKILKAAENVKMSPDSGFYPDLGTSTCPLCWLFLKELGDRISCNGCPIKEKTGRNGCVNSPYDPEIVDAITIAEYIPALKAEIAFLKEIENEM